MEEPHLQILYEIEELEFATLIWGDIYGSLSEGEVDELAKDYVDNRDEDEAEELVDKLTDAKLLIKNGRTIRSRFAETVKLLVQLRQLSGRRAWQASPKLVSDFRVDLRKRAYPKRDQPADFLKTKLKELKTTPLREALWSALTGTSPETPPMHLSAFQVRSIERLLSQDKFKEAGTIITAGTGSGKTLAYYLPSFLGICDLINKDQNWVKALSIYPKNELLKDQLAETFKLARKADEVLKNNNKRPILIGTFFGPTPASPESLKKNKKDSKHVWQYRASGFVCPFISCPECNKKLIWYDDDIENNNEKLNCESCSYIISDDHLVLTRDRLKRTPPDILFTTTEMLNRRMSDIEMRKLFGLGQTRNQKPQFILLDEVHSYTGTTGAQTALLLRRWKHLLNAPVNWCGLSATLKSAPQFFSDLTGLNYNKIEEITPNENENENRGAEYQVILKGDPTQRTGALSTSIQSAMLLSRMLDDQDKAISGGVFGKRLFIFTDDLDVTNRFYDDLNDAEGRNWWGRPERGRRTRAFYRKEPVPYDNKKVEDGQRWKACEEIGHDLEEKLEIGRTTSQDPNVQDRTNAIVATSALEVGYNDENVGAVLQHKAPFNYSSYLQRKGRAGRPPAMRPMMVTVLSATGKDRVIFNYYDILFNPIIRNQALPIKNQYVLRMQAVFSMIDWLAVKIVDANDVKYSDLWQLLSQEFKKDKEKDKCLNEIKKILQKLRKNNPETIRSLSYHLKHSLNIDDDEVVSILYDPPRSLILEAVPTLYRRLHRRWKLVNQEGGQKEDIRMDYQPLPDYVPQNLFSDLSLPEVQIELPKNDDTKKEKSLSIYQAIKRLAPGRVTRQFAEERGGLSHWIKIDVTNCDQEMLVEKYAKNYEILGVFNAKNEDGTKEQFPVYRPWNIELSEVDKREVEPTSNAFPVWFSEFLVEEGMQPLVLGMPKNSSWFNYLSDFNFLLHRFRSSMLVRRFTHEIQANIRRGEDRFFSVVRFTNAERKKAAVGFELEVDGFFVDIKLPEDKELIGLLTPELELSSRSAYLKDLWVNDPELGSEIGKIDREWMFQILLSASIAQAIKNAIPLEDAAVEILEKNIDYFFSTMEKMFELEVVPEEAELDENGDEQDEVDEEMIQGRLEERIMEHLGKKEVKNRLKFIAQQFREQDEKSFSKWLRRTLSETMSQALLQACINTANHQASHETLIADFDSSEDEDKDGRVWISETTMGGAGAIQAFAEAYSSEPRSFYRAIETALAPTEMELSSRDLKYFVSLACDDESIKDCVDRLRKENGHSERQAIQKKLYKELMNKGLNGSGYLKVSINTRFLKPGMSKDGDDLIRELLDEWEKLENEYRIEIGLNEFCFIALELPGIRGKIINLIGQDEDPESKLINILSSLLWPKGLEVRQYAFESYHPYREQKTVDPMLVRSLILNQEISQVELSNTFWKEDLKKCLQNFGTVQLIAKKSENKALRDALMKIISTPVEIEYLLIMPIIERTERSDSEIKVTITLREKV